MITWDDRWQGDYGIARFGREIRQRLPGAIADIASGPSPASPLDPIYLATRLASMRPSVHVTPGFNAALSRVPQLICVHDLIHLEVGDERSYAKHLYYGTVVRPVLRRSPAVVTVSEFSRERLVAWAGLDPAIVHVVPNGISQSFVNVGADLEGFEGSVDVSPYILFVGNSKPHKRFSLLVEALGCDRRLHDVDVITVGLTREYVARCATEVGLGIERFHVLGRVSDDELAVLYRDARCLAMPSSYEGFGLMAAEAMACGTATAYVCDAVGEVVGEAGFRAVEDAPESYADALWAAISAGTRGRAKLLERSAIYSWSASAKRFNKALASFR